MISVFVFYTELKLFSDLFTVSMATVSLSEVCYLQPAKDENKVGHLNDI